MKVLTRTKRLIEMTKARTGRDGWRDGKGQVGIDSNKDASFGKMRKGSDPWEVRPASVDYVRGDGVARRDTVKSAGQRYTDNESGLRDTGTDPENYSKVDIFDMVESQSDKPGPVVLRKRDR
jgi:hypothetical protein